MRLISLSADESSMVKAAIHRVSKDRQDALSDLNPAVSYASEACELTNVASALRIWELTSAMTE